MKTRLPDILLPGFLALPVLAHAEAPAPVEIGGGILQMLLSLGVVIGLLFASLYLLKKLSAPRGVAAGLLRVIAGVAIGTRERVVVVEVGETWLVLGVAPGGVTRLHEMPRQTAPSQDAPVAPTHGFGSEFAERLRQSMGRHHAAR